MHGRAKLTPPDTYTAPVTDWATPACVAQLRSLIDHRLDALSTGHPNCPASLNNAIRHALLAPGKRFRPLLTVLTAAEFGVQPRTALDAACAVELVHTASLVLDDLPCMDDAATRRGIASAHTAFGEATAMLAAIAMLTRAFGIISQMDGLPSAARIDLTALLSNASGANGLAAGQERDLHDRSPADPLDKINTINDQKTGVLFAAALQMGGRIANVNDARMGALAAAGREIGLAFQALDDVIDQTSSIAEAGKDTGKDAGKATVATVLGLDAARAQVAHHIQLAHFVLEPHAPASGPLRTFITAIFGQSSGA
ncbi:MAG: polyprenyl synthetase family protein [Hyphomicrobiaceae bacterium]